MFMLRNIVLLAMIVAGASIGADAHEKMNLLRGTKPSQSRHLCDKDCQEDMNEAGKAIEGVLKKATCGFMGLFNVTCK